MTTCFWKIARKQVWGAFSVCGRGLKVLDVITKEAEQVPGNKPIRSILHSLCLKLLPDFLQRRTVMWSWKLKQSLPFQVAFGHGFIKVEGTLMKTAMDLRTVTKMQNSSLIKEFGHSEANVTATRIL